MELTFSHQTLWKAVVFKVPEVDGENTFLVRHRNVNGTEVSFITGDESQS